MKVILKQDVESVGSVGDIVEVKNGYARNYLVPQGMALEATRGNLKQIDQEKKTLELQKNREKKTAEELANKLNNTSITISVPVGEENRLFGSVTSQDIADSLKEKDFKIDKRKIILEEPIKVLGIYSVPIKIHSEVEAKVKVWVVKK
ncbi:50S ribosomal protein L9 [bacterium BMS3Abin05]|nr:50S ribosomal protein L9 [bacterium BMS3Abin05]GBE26869.1 50S ribosomal protein L9 [bacterium BMS3Bbin03]HDZ10762.1 50S ribosomal protein L9 [Bacteroidota bacterium]